MLFACLNCSLASEIITPMLLLLFKSDHFEHDFGVEDLTHTNFS